MDGKSVGMPKMTKVPDAVSRARKFSLRNGYWDYRLDSIEEVGIPALWYKANPNLEITTSIESYR